MGPWTAIGTLALALAQAGPGTERVSVSSRGIQGNASSGTALLSADGSRAVFFSDASNLVPRDRNRRADVFLRDRATGRTTRVMRRASLSAPGGTPFYYDGRSVGFVTYTDTSHYFVRDLETGATTQLDLDAQGRPAELWLDDAVSASDGVAHLAFTSFEEDSESIQVEVRDRAAATTTLVSVAAGGGPGNNQSREPSISADGRYVAFHSSATNLVPGDANGQDDVFVRDRLLGTTARVSADGPSSRAAISPDGRIVAFQSDAADLVPGDTNDATDIFAHDRVTGTTTRISVTSAGAQARGESFSPRFLGPRLVGFNSNAADLVPGDTNRRFDHYVHELDTGRTIWAAAGRRRRSLTPSSYPISFSADGRWVAFTSIEPGHVRRDTNNRSDAFVFGPLREPWRLPAPATTAAAASAPRRPVAPYDFDADGRQDLTLGLPRFQPVGTPDAGAVLVLPGTRRGPSAARQVITRETPSVPGLPYGDDAFGSALASADFNADGFADLAVAVPGDEAVYVLQGSRRGLTGAGTKQLRRGTGVLVAGDLDGDGYGDLVAASTRLRVHLGGPRSLARRPTRTLAAPRGARRDFGEALALGDIDGDGHLDLVEGAVGAPLTLDFEHYPGHLTYCPGTPSGPTVCRRVLGGRPGPAALAVGDVTGDGRDDVVAGIPVSRFHDQGDLVPGRVTILPGTSGGPGAPVTGTPDSAGVPGRSRPDDTFGTAVAARRIDRDRYADLVVGAGGRRLWILRGGPSGLAAGGHVVAGARGRGFGATVGVLDTDRRGRPEIIAGMPAMGNGDRGLGGVAVLHLGRDLRPARARSHSLRSLRLSAPEAPDAFSGALGLGSVLGLPAASSSSGYDRF